MTSFIQGFVMVDAWASALNNAGTQPSERTENIVRTKVFWRDREAYPYVSGQSWRYWWRNTLAKRKNWNLSPIHREKKIAYTEANPLTYEDDDVFGYMRAPKGKKKQTLTRVSPLKTSALISIGSHRPTADFGTFSRLEGDPVPYEHEFYSTVLKGIFSIDVTDVGFFKNKATAGSQNLPEDFEIPEEFADKCEERDDGFAMKNSIRIKRIHDVIEVLPYLEGGAMQARHLTRVAPSLLVLGAFDTGSHLFSHLAAEENGRATLNISALEQILSDYEDIRLTKIYIGRQEGFMDDLSDNLKELHEKFSDTVTIGSVASAVEDFSSELDKLVE